MSKKKMLSLIMSCALLVAMSAGCNSETSSASAPQESSSTPTSSAAPQSSSYAVEPEKPDEVIVLKGISKSAKAFDWDSPIGQEFIKQTGVRIDIETFPDYNARLAVLASSGQWPDLVEQVDDNTVFYDMGMLLPLDDLIDQYGTNIKKMFNYGGVDTMVNLRKSPEDPHIYSLGRTTFFKEPIGVVSQPYTLQLDVVRELGYPEIKTFEQYADAIRTYMKNHPTIDGQPTIGITLLCETYWNFVFSVTNPANYATGGSDNGDFLIDPDTGETAFIQLKPESKEVYRWYNQMWNEGLLDKDSFVQKKDQYLEKMASGRVLGTVNTLGTYSPAMTSLRSEGKDWRTVGYFPIALSEEYDSSIYWNAYGRNLNWGGLMVTTACENPEAYVKFADFYCSDEGQYLLDWGLEGVHYTVENGRRVRIPEVAEKLATDPTYIDSQGFQLFTGIMPFYQEGIKDANGDYYKAVTPETVATTYSEAEKEVLSHYGVTTWKELFKDEFPYPKYASIGNNPFGDPEMTAIITRCREIIQEKLVQAITAPVEEFDLRYDEMVAALEEAGMNTITEKYEVELHKMHKMWGME